MKCNTSCREMTHLRVKLDIQGLAQYNAAVGQEIQNSVCGPVTAHVILNLAGSSYKDSFSFIPPIKQFRY